MDQQNWFHTEFVFSFFFISLKGNLLLIKKLAHVSCVSWSQKTSEKGICQSYFTLGRSHKPQTNKWTWCECGDWLFTGLTRSTLARPSVMFQSKSLSCLQQQIHHSLCLATTKKDLKQFNQPDRFRMLFFHLSKNAWQPDLMDNGNIHFGLFRYHLNRKNNVSIGMFYFGQKKAEKEYFSFSLLVTNSLKGMCSPTCVYAGRCVKSRSLLHQVQWSCRCVCVCWCPHTQASDSAQ